MGMARQYVPHPPRREAADGEGETMTEHCGYCGSQLCNHGNCPECNPCRHCYGGDRENKFFGYIPEDDPVDRLPNRDRFEE